MRNDDSDSNGKKGDGDLNDKSDENGEKGDGD
jgi:hypothetical protein